MIKKILYKGSNGKIKLLLILVLYIGYQSINSQHWTQILIEKTDSLYQDSTNNWSTSLFYSCVEADSLLTQHFFEKDTNVMNSLKRFLDNLKGFYNPLGSIGEFRHKAELYNDFHTHHNNINQDSIVQIVINDPERYLKFHQLRYDTTLIESLISDSSKNVFIRSFCYLYHYNYSDSAYLSRKYYRNINYFILFPKDFLSILNGFLRRTEGKVPSDMVAEQQRYLTLFDTAQKEYRDEFLKYFFNILSPEDQAWVDEQDRIRQSRMDSMLYADSIQHELDMWERPGPLTAEDSIRMYIKSDTTFVEYITGQISIYPQDDGRRFDTFSNEQLILFLDTLSFSLIYPPDTPYVYGYRSNTAQIHLHKVCQILGDRRAYGSFTPDSAQQAVVNRFMDTLIAYGNMQEDLKSAIPKNREAGNLALRLGRLAIPRFLHYTQNTPHDKWTWIIRPRDIFKQITESDLLLFISKADELLSSGDTTSAKTIGSYLYNNISTEVYIDPEQRRPRRPVAPTRERQRWADEYIWPLLLRMNHWYTRMK